MSRHIAFQFGEVFISTEALAAPLFDDVISRHGEHPPDICRIMMTIGCRVEISEKFRAEHPDDAKLIDAGNVLMTRAVDDKMTSEIAR